jgi:V-type H+-transporting ATPase subunit H
MASFVNEYAGKSPEQVSSILYCRIVPWSRIQSAGVFLSASNEKLIEKAQDHLESFMNNADDAAELVRLYYTLANNCTYDLQVQQYVFTRFEEILQLGAAAAAANSSSQQQNQNSNNNKQRGGGFAHLFISKEGELNDGAFIRALTNSDPYLQMCAARGLATIYANIPEDLLPLPAAATAATGEKLSVPLSPSGGQPSGPALDAAGRVSNLSNLVYWMKNALTSALTQEGKFDVVIPALMSLVHCTRARPLLLEANVIGLLSSIATSLGVTGNPQSLYEICFVLWTLSLSVDSSSSGSSSSGSSSSGSGRASGSSSVSMFSQAGTVRLLVELVAAAPSRKITRMTLACLLNLVRAEDQNILSEIFSTTLPRLVTSMTTSDSYKSHKDPEFEADVKALASVLDSNYRELSTFERWVSEVNSGSLRWGLVHTEKFWKENHKFMESEDWKALTKLISCLDSTDSTTVCVALFDLGEFTRVYPNGRVITSRLGGKDKALKLVQSDSDEIQSHALQSVSKIMIGWDATTA